MIEHRVVELRPPGLRRIANSETTKGNQKENTNMQTTMRRKTTTLAVLVAVSFGLITSAPAALIGQWTFNELGGTGVYDTSGGGNPGTISGGAGRVAAPGGYAVSLDGVDDLVTFGPSLFNIPGAQSLEVWVNKTTTPAPTGEATIFGKDYVSAAISAYYDGAYYGYIDGGGNNVSTGVIPTGGWEYMVLTYDGVGTLEFFRNGISQGTDTVPSPPVGPTANPLIVGGPSIFTAYFNGLVDQAAIYDHQLSTGEIAANFAAGASTALNVPEPSVAALLTLAGAMIFRRRKKME